MNSPATPNIDGVSPVTAADLVTLAGTLIDSQDIDDNPDDSERSFRAGAKAGIVAMCKSATSAINAFGALSLAQQAGPAPAEQHGDTQSKQGVKQQCDRPGQHPTTTQQATRNLSKLQHADTILGEKRAGSVIDMATGVIYDVMLMPGELECVTWAEAKTRITAAGGDLPTREEMLLLYKLLGSLAFRENQYWTDDKVKFIDEHGDSITYFCDGWFEITEATDRMNARGVRRISVGDVADDGADPIDDSYVVVPAPAAPNNAASTTGPELSDRPDLKAMRASLFNPVPPVTMESIAGMLDELNGIKEADDDAQLATGVCYRVIDLINGLILIADPEQLK